MIVGPEKWEKGASHAGLPSLDVAEKQGSAGNQWNTKAESRLLVNRGPYSARFAAEPKYKILWMLITQSQEMLWRGLSGGDGIGKKDKGQRPMYIKV